MNNHVYELISWSSNRNGNDGRKPTSIGKNTTKLHIVREGLGVTVCGVEVGDEDVQTKPFPTWTPSGSRYCKKCLKAHKLIREQLRK